MLHARSAIHGHCGLMRMLAVRESRHWLRAGDVAYLVDHVEHPAGGERGCVLQVFNALGDSIATVTVPESAIEPLAADEVMTVRRLQAS